MELVRRLSENDEHCVRYGYDSFDVWGWTELVPFTITGPGLYRIRIYLQDGRYAPIEECHASFAVVMEPEAEIGPPAENNPLIPDEKKLVTDLPYRLVDSSILNDVLSLDEEKRLKGYGRRSGKTVYARCPLCGYTWKGPKRRGGAKILEIQAPCGHWLLS